MNLPLTKQWITRWEGYRTTAYDDANGRTIIPGMVVLGNPTIGVGFNLNSLPAAVSILDSMNLDYLMVKTGALSLNADQIDSILTTQIATAQAGAINLCPNFNSFTDYQQLVLIDVVFNMGETEFSKFKMTLSSVNSGNWIQAANNLQNSAWFHQVGSNPNQRGGADVAVLSGSTTPEHILGIT